MIIDSHAHVVLPVEKHIELMDEAGIDKKILINLGSKILRYFNLSER